MESRSRSALNSLMVLLVQVLAKLMALVATLYAARLVGASQYGLYTYALSVTAVAGMISDLGLSPFLVRQLASNPAGSREFFAVVLGLRTMAGVLLMAGLGVAAVFTRSEASLGPLLITVGLYTVLSQVADTFARAFAAKEAWAAFNLVAMLGQVLGLFLSIVLLARWTHILALPVGLSLGYVAAVAVSWSYLSRRWFRVELSISLSAWRDVLVQALPFTAGAVVGLLSQRIDSLLLYHAAGSTAVGIYGASFSLLFSLSIIPGACSSVLAPKLAAHAQGEGLTKTAGHVRLFLKVLLGVGLPAAAGVALLSGSLAPLLYGRGFAGMAPVLATLAWWLPAMFVQTLLVSAYGAIGRQRVVVWVIAGSVIAAILVGYPMQLKWGAVGAAAARTLVDWISMLIMVGLLPQRRLAVPRVRELIGVGVATCIMAVPVWLLGRAHMILAIGAGILVYAIFILVFGCFGTDELPFLRYVPIHPIRLRGEHSDTAATGG